MNTLRNKVQLIGNLGNDPEIINLESGKLLAKISIATNENYKNAKGEKVTDTQWHNVVAWGKTAEIIEKYVTKGKEIAIEGKLTHRSYETKEGEKTLCYRNCLQRIIDARQVISQTKREVIYTIFPFLCFLVCATNSTASLSSVSKNI